MSAKFRREKTRRKNKQKETGSSPARWKRNLALAQYAGVTPMTLYRWKQLPDFPAAACINGIEYNDIHKFNSWMRKHPTPSKSRRTWLREGRNCKTPELNPETAPT